MKIKVLVPISGGKDSQACLKLATQKFSPDEILGLFCDTQFEHPWTYAHVEWLRTLYGPIQFDQATRGSVLDVALKERRFPMGGARGCTDKLKIKLTRDYVRDLCEHQGARNLEVWYGMRSGESTKRNLKYRYRSSDELYPPHEILPTKYPKLLSVKYGVMFRLPILEWSTDEVFAFLDHQHNPLYDEGFDRVGCFPCLAAGDKYKERAFRFDATGRKHHEQVIDVSHIIGKSVWESKGGKLRNEGPSCALGACE